MTIAADATIHIKPGTSLYVPRCHPSSLAGTLIYCPLEPKAQEAFLTRHPCVRVIHQQPSTHGAPHAHPRL